MNSYDVVIIGGGPAGASSAIHLRKLGHKVLIIEKDLFPRAHVGESLVPFCYYLLEELGVLDELKSTAVRKPGVKFINHDGSLETTYCFKNILDGPEHMSFHVLRARFDKQLLDRAKKVGAEVKEQCKVVDINFEKQNTQVTFRDNNNEKQFVQCKYVIDASGQDSYLASKLKTKSPIEGLVKVGIGGHWADFDPQTEINDGLLHLCYLEEDKKGWIGLQAVDRNRMSAVLVTEAKYFKSYRQKHKHQEDWQKQFYFNELKSTPFTHALLKNASMVNELMVVSDYSYTNSQKFNSKYACVGDAAGFIDPIFATGVYLALNSAKLVAQSVNTLLKEGETSGLSALKKSYDHYEGALNMLKGFIHNFYDPSFVNLAELGQYKDTKDKNHFKHKIAFSLVHFVMGGDFFYNYKRYAEFVEFLKSPKQLERFKHLVIDQEKYHETNCKQSEIPIFPEQSVK